MIAEKIRERARTLLAEGRPLYELGPGESWIRCRICGMTSHNPNDARQRYCGYCHAFFDDVVRAVIEESDA